MHRFMVQPVDIKNDCITITGDDLKHLKQVLRLKAGDAISVFDGTGMEYGAQLVSVDKDTAIAKVMSSQLSDTEPSSKLTLYQGLPKAEKMEMIIQKAVELGVYRIVPVITERTVVQLDGKDIDKKLERWNRIAREAAKQCRRARVPEVAPPVKVRDLQDQQETWDLSVVLYENQQKKCLKELLKCYNINKIVNIALFIGSEGGFSDTEIDFFRGMNIQVAGLGKRILRTETAALTGISIIMYEMGEMQ